MMMSGEQMGRKARGIAAGLAAEDEAAIRDLDNRVPKARATLATTVLAGAALLAGGYGQRALCQDADASPRRVDSLGKEPADAQSPFRAFVETPSLQDGNTKAFARCLNEGLAAFRVQRQEENAVSAKAFAAGRGMSHAEMLQLRHAHENEAARIVPRLEYKCAQR